MKNQIHFSLHHCFKYLSISPHFSTNSGSSVPKTFSEPCLSAYIIPTNENHTNSLDWRNSGLVFMYLSERKSDSFENRKHLERKQMCFPPLLLNSCNISYKVWKPKTWELEKTKRETKTFVNQMHGFHKLFQHHEIYFSALCIISQWSHTRTAGTRKPLFLTLCPRSHAAHIQSISYVSYIFSNLWIVLILFVMHLVPSISTKLFYGK